MVEPVTPPDAAAPMSAQLRPEGAPPRWATHDPVCMPAEPGAAAFDHWLKRELGRLYDATLSEAMPESLQRLLDAPPAWAPEGARTKRRKTLRGD